MFDNLRNFQRTPKPSIIDPPITRVLDEMDIVGPDHHSYPGLIENLSALHDIKAKRPMPRISPDALIYAGANLLGIVIIVAYEQKHAFASKALPQLFKIPSLKTPH